MSHATLNATATRGKGSRNARRLRLAGSIPAVVYGEGVEPLPIAVEAKSFRTAVSGEQAPREPTPIRRPRYAPLLEGQAEMTCQACGNRIVFKPSLGFAICNVCGSEFGETNPRPAQAAPAPNGMGEQESVEPVLGADEEEGGQFGSAFTPPGLWQVRTEPVQ